MGLEGFRVFRFSALDISASRILRLQALDSDVNALDFLGWGSWASGLDAAPPHTLNLGYALCPVECVLYLYVGGQGFQEVAIQVL